MYRLLHRSLTDLGLATYPAKKAHQRAGSLPVIGEAICTPDDRELLETDGSYPSGDSGWGWALILSQLAPEKAKVLLALGRAHARSRKVCNVRWMSGTEASMAVGAAAFARLQNNELFQATMAAARAELSLGNNPDAEACVQEAATPAMSY